MTEHIADTPDAKPGDVVIERARPDDAEVICDIRDQARMAVYPNSELGITADDVRMMSQGPSGEYVPRRIAYLREQLARQDTPEPTFVAKLDGKVIGYTTIGADDENRRMIHDIYVVPGVQGKGVGSKLMRQALDYFGSDQDIYLEVVSYNHNAIDFYKRFGFVATGNEVPREPNRPAYLKDLPQIEMKLPARAKVQ